MSRTLPLSLTIVANATTIASPLTENAIDLVPWSVAAPAIGAAFLASLVEVVEAFTIVLAVSVLRGWRPAALGTAAGLGVLGLLIVALGPLLDRIPLHLLQLVIGVLLLL